MQHCLLCAALQCCDTYLRTLSHVPSARRPGRVCSRAVANDGETIAITQNYAPPSHLLHVLAVLESYGGEPYRASWEPLFRPAPDPQNGCRGA